MYVYKVVVSCIELDSGHSLVSVLIVCVVFELLFLDVYSSTGSWIGCVFS